MSKELKEVLIARTRKPKARQKDVVIGCLEERIVALEQNYASDGDAPVHVHVMRIRELMDELKRSVSNAKDAEE